MCHQEELQRRDEIAAIYTVALKANTPLPQVRYLVIVSLSGDMKESKQMI